MRRSAASSLDRRTFLKTTLVAAGAAAVKGAGAPAASGSPPPDGLIDVNVSLSRWPLRRVRFDDAAGLAAMLGRQGVARAWAGSFDALLHKDLAAANARLADDCRRSGDGRLVPFGSVNPKLPDWEEDLRRCVEVHRMPGLRLYPNYHGYKLDDPEFGRLAGLARDLGLVVEVALIMEDRRMMHPLLQVEPADATPLVDVLKSTPGLRLVLLNALRTVKAPLLAELVGAGEVYVDIAMLDGVQALAELLTRVPAARVLFGSYAPLFVFEAAPLKLLETPLGEDVLKAVRFENARRLLASRSAASPDRRAPLGISETPPAD